MDLTAIDIYRLVLSQPDVRQLFHPKHLKDYTKFYEGLRSPRKNLGLFTKKD